MTVKSSLKTILLCLMCLISFDSFCDENEYIDSIYISVGQSHIIKYPGVKRVSIGSGDIAQVKVIEETKEILLFAKRQGSTDLRVWDNNGRQVVYDIEIDDNGMGPSVDEVLMFIRKMKGIDIDTVHGDYYISGQAANSGDYAKLQQLLKTYPDIQSSVLPPAFERQPTVLLHARLLEVKKSALQNLGINWSDTMDGPIYSFLGDFDTNNIYRSTNAPGGASSTLPFNVGGHNTYLGMSSSLDSVINILSQNGDVHLLAEPTLSCISGGNASFLAGGEVPIPVVSNDGVANVDYKEFGIGLNIEPVVDYEGYIKTKVKVEVSGIDSSVVVNGFPGFSTRKAETQMNIFNGQTMVVAGLFSQNASKNIDKVPALGDIPIIGELFKSREFKNNETELVVLITPKAISEKSADNLNYIKKFDSLDASSKKSLGIME